MGLLDVLTGGSNERAARALKEAQDKFGSIPLPTQAELTLPELQKYVQAGIMTPAEAKAYLVDGNAYNDIKPDSTNVENQTDVLSKLKEISASKGMTPAMQAQLTEALDQVGTEERGANASITDQFAQRGVPTSLMAEAAMRDEAANASRNANLTATQAAGTAEQNAMTALMNEGNLATSMRGENYNEAADKAKAENAIREWNAGTQTNTSEANAGREQQATGYNVGTAQDVSNMNVGNANKRTEYNANIPQQTFNNAITKAGGQAGVSQNQAKQATDEGNQQMGLYGAIIGAGGNLLHKADGGVIPGEPEVPGDSRRNDKIPAMLSPGEAVLPRTIMNSPDAPDRARGFVQHLIKSKPVQAAHPDDVHAILEALTKRREAPQVGSTRG